MTAFLIAAHRGAMVSEPENTMRSFLRAVAVGAGEIELDVHLSADGALVVIHDETVDRTTDRSGAVLDLTREELGALDAGHGERIPELTDVLDAVAIDVQIEVKTAAASERVAELLAHRDDAPRCTVTSFHPDALRAADRPGRAWRLGLITGPGVEDRLHQAAALRVERLLVHWDSVDHPLVREFGRDCITVWPCNDAASVIRAVTDRYAGLTTDDPALAVRLVASDHR
jgi:glycerophosphoryl diester phosphodiesterase